MIESLGAADHPVAGRYVLVDQIGAGGMGSVWRAYDVRTQSWVAAKVLTQRSSAMLLRFVREQGLRIQHPHVVAPTGWAADDDVVVFTMDLIRGGTVADLVAEHGPLPLPYAGVLLDQLLQALAAVHAAGVVHRDVKPANLLLEVTGRARPHLRLGDFGVAATTDAVRLTQAPGMVGTEGYAAPEQAAGAPPDPRQDLYAAGRVGLQMLTGLGPHLQTEVPDCPLAPLLRALTAPDPADRPATAAEAQRWLLRLAAEASPGGLRPRPDGPEVRDRLGDAVMPLRRGLALPAAAARRTGSARVVAALGCFAGAIGLCAVALTRVLG
ncbi:serine/threonine-protein kinase [Nocardioides sp. DS6]|uniref:non-specific serine/threonine protein kinase n=1 Tax=Nocardioides eburneus TaxID=3231482 RepID=A0ABV3SZX9_9ACTN